MELLTYCTTVGGGDDTLRSRLITLRRMPQELALSAAKIPGPPRSRQDTPNANTQSTRSVDAQNATRDPTLPSSKHHHHNCENRMTKNNEQSRQKSMLTLVFFPSILTDDPCLQPTLGKVCMCARTRQFRGGAVSSTSVHLFLRARILYGRPATALPRPAAWLSGHRRRVKAPTQLVPGMLVPGTIQLGHRRPVCPTSINISSSRTT